MKPTREQVAVGVAVGTALIAAIGFGVLHEDGTWWAVRVNGRTIGAEKVFVTINGVPQGLIITSRDPGHPVLLYLHGGMPDYFLARLEAAPVLSDAYYRLRDGAMHRLGVGTTHARRSVVTGIFLPSLQCRDYTLSDDACRDVARNE